MQDNYQTMSNNIVRNHNMISLCRNKTVELGYNKKEIIFLHAENWCDHFGPEISSQSGIGHLTNSENVILKPKNGFNWTYLIVNF